MTLREARKLSVFENMVLRRIFGPRRDDKMLIKWRRIGWAGHVARMGEERGCIGS